MLGVEGVPGIWGGQRSCIKHILFFDSLRFKLLKQALPADPRLDRSHVCVALLRTYLDLVARTSPFLGYPTKLWTLSKVAGARNYSGIV